MHRQSLPFTDVPDDCIVRDRMAAGRHLHGHAFGAAYNDRYLAGLRNRARALRILALGGIQCKLACDNGRQLAAQSDIGQQVFA